MNARSSRYIRDLIEQPVVGTSLLLALRQFASDFGWRPSDEIDRFPGTEDFSNGHLVVEHGFDQTAVISFLRSDTPYEYLSPAQRRCLLEISYNNMVDVHLLPERGGIRVVYNRTNPPKDFFFSHTSDLDVWRSDAFAIITGSRPNPNIKALDDALISTVSFWKRAIQSDLAGKVQLSQISSIINAILMVRSLEDFQNRGARIPGMPLLISILSASVPGEANLYSVVRRSLTALGKPDLPSWLNAMVEDLKVLDGWDSSSLFHLLSDFYRSKFSEYKYNFDLISKHALSRIYEHYVSVLRDSSADELTLFRMLPEEVRNRDLGSVYTPQYVARFFARYLREHRTPREFRSMRTLDPACGSGMFLRTLLEMQCNPADESFSAASVALAYSGAYGIDVDANACQATRLSLALLHLVLTGDFPQTLNVARSEALSAIQRSPQFEPDNILANPPYIKWEGLTPELRATVSAILGSKDAAKPDAYLAFLKLAMERVKPDGAICFVLPHNFLIAKNATSLRRELSSKFAVRILVDLSEIPVFEGTGAYVLLLIAEKTEDKTRAATIARCRAFVGTALMDALSERVIQTDAYEVYKTPQSAFAAEKWTLPRPAEASLIVRMQAHPRLEELLEVRQGLITGNDAVFVRSVKGYPKEDRAVWTPLLTDREMERYKVPTRHTAVVFMPFDEDGEPLTESQLRKKYKATWEYLKSHKQALENRSTVKRGGQWWQPAWPRSPDKMLVPKIVTPHLVLLPRFGIDIDGKYAVSHCPYLVPKQAVVGESYLKVICAFLNSSAFHWQLATNSHRYGHGYLKLEVATLKGIRMPDPAKLAPSLTKKLIKLVNSCGESPDDENLVRELDSCVAEAYGLGQVERGLTGADH